MKKLSFALALVLFLLSGCAPVRIGLSYFIGKEAIKPFIQTTSLPDFVNGEQKALFENRGERLPVAVSCSKYKEDGLHEGFIYSQTAVKKMMDYLENIDVGRKSNIDYSDANTIYTFYYEDGGTVSFDFMPDQVNVDGTYYLITVKSRLDISFPGINAELGNVSPTETMREFFARIEMDLPAQIIVTEDAESNSITTQDEIGMVCDLFWNMSPYGAYNKNDFGRIQEEQDLAKKCYTFVMEDGTEYEFRFVGNYLCVDFPEPFGTWGYYIDDFSSEMPY